MRAKWIVGGIVGTLGAAFFGLFAVLIHKRMPSPYWSIQYYAAPDGDDRNDCLSPQAPCRSGRAAIRKMPPGIHNLQLAPGKYAEVLDVNHGRQVTIWGPFKGDACVDPALVAVDGIDVQDNATIWVGCLTAKHIGCRQWSIADIEYVIIGEDGKQAVSANETCRINFVRTIWVDANIAALAVATNYSTIHVGARIELRTPATAPNYLFRAEDATIDLRNATFLGHSLASGLRYSLDNGILFLPRGGVDAIPGNGGESVNRSICRPACN